MHGLLVMLSNKMLVTQIKIVTVVKWFFEIVKLIELLCKWCDFIIGDKKCSGTELIPNPKYVMLVVGPSVCFVSCNRHPNIFTDGSKYVHKFGAFIIINTRAYGQKVITIMTKIVRFGTINYRPVVQKFRLIFEIHTREWATKWKAFVKLIKFTGFYIK